MDIRIITRNSKNEICQIFQLPYKTTKNGYLIKAIQNAIEESKELAAEIDGKVELEWCKPF